MRVEENLRETFSEIIPGPRLYQRDKINAFLLTQVYQLRNVYNNKNNREIFFRFAFCIFAFRGLDPPLRLCVELGHGVVRNLDSKLIIFLILFINPQETDLKSSTRLKV